VKGNSDRQPQAKERESTLLKGRSQPTIFFGPHPHRGTLRARAHIGVCPHPHLILSPLLQAFQQIAGDVDTDAHHLMALRVLPSQGLVADCVAHDGAVAASGGRGHPTHLEAGGAQADQMYILRGGGWGCRGRGAQLHGRGHGSSKPKENN